MGAELGLAHRCGREIPRGRRAECGAAQTAAAGLTAGTEYTLLHTPDISYVYVVWSGGMNRIWICVQSGSPIKFKWLIITITLHWIW